MTLKHITALRAFAFLESLNNPTVDETLTLCSNRAKECNTTIQDLLDYYLTTMIEMCQLGFGGFKL